MIVNMHIEKLMNILAEFSNKNPQANIAATDTQRELSQKIVAEWDFSSDVVHKRTDQTDYHHIILQCG